MRFIDKIKEKARSKKMTIVLPEGSEERTMKAAEEVIKEDIAELILIKDDVDLSKNEEFGDFVETFYELRKHKGITKEDAAKIMNDPTYYAVMMVKKGLADAMVSGAIHSTADTLRPALQILKTAPGSKLVSSFFIMDVPNSVYGDEGVIVMGDSALVEEPNSEELAEIAIATAKSTKAFLGVEPKVALLSYSTMGSASSPEVTKVQEAVKLIHEKAPNLDADGEMQLDAAIIPSIAELKAPNSKVAGQANTLIFPDINAGNIGYKLVQRFAKADAYGPVLQGLAKPVNDLSRGSTVEDIIGTIALTAVQAQNEQ